MVVMGGLGLPIRIPIIHQDGNKMLFTAKDAEHAKACGGVCFFNQ